jgi:hypothetical protein
MGPWRLFEKEVQIIKFLTLLTHPCLDRSREHGTMTKTSEAGPVAVDSMGFATLSNQNPKSLKGRT